MTKIGLVGLGYWGPNLARNFDELAELSAEDRRWLAEALHAEPHKAAKVGYERQHTGFCREIVATRGDVERLYRERILTAQTASAPQSEK